MAKKTTKVADKPVAAKGTASQVTAKTAAETAAAAPGAVANPAPATAMDSASGAVIEPAIVDAIDMTHPAIDANPRAGTVAMQNARDMNDPANRRPDDPNFVGEGLDPTVYGKKAR